VLRQCLSVILVVANIAQLLGCTSVHTQSVPLDTKREGDRIIGVVTQDGNDLRFDRPGYIAGDSVHGVVKGGSVQVPLSNVQRVWVEERKTSVVKTIGLTAGVIVVGAVAIVGIALATKESCPFVYSWTGDNFEFDAEPYGGATSRGLERDDYGELQHLRAEDGRYRLLVRNEVAETQYTNLMELWVVDHSPNTHIAADEHGGLHTLADPRPPVKASDKAGRDLLPWLEADDQLIWEPPAVPDAEGSLRGEIVLEFERPTAAQTSKLVAKVSTGQWGSHMIRELLGLRGSELPAFYGVIDSDPMAARALFEWNLREELYTLKVEVEEPDGWVVRGLLPGGGPFIAEQRVVSLDTSRVVGDRLRVRLRPPAGFWALNSFAIDSTPDASLTVTKLAPVEATDSARGDMRQALMRTDDAYYAMPDIGDEATVSFREPPAVSGKARTIFLHSRGWYRLHMPDDVEPDVEQLQRVSDVPGAVLAFAADKYSAWLGESNRQARIR
jgi:hypothetical protein